MWKLLTHHLSTWCQTPTRKMGALALVSLAWCSAQEPITLDLPFGSGMVLPRDQMVTVRGSCAPRQRVVLRFGPKQAAGRSDSDGRFAVPLHAGAVSADPAELVITAGDAELRLDDVLVGDVWLCAGQSNMAWPLGKAATAEAALQRARHDQW